MDGPIRRVDRYGEVVRRKTLGTNERKSDTFQRGTTREKTTYSLREREGSKQREGEGQSEGYGGKVGYDKELSTIQDSTVYEPPMFVCLSLVVENVINTFPYVRLQPQCPFYSSYERLNQ